MSLLDHDPDPSVLGSFEVPVHQVLRRLDLERLGFANQRDGLRGTGRHTNAASDAPIRLNDVLVFLLGDGLHGASLVRADSAGSARFLIDDRHEITFGHQVRHIEPFYADEHPAAA
jgi:hypothetical protein